MTTNVSYFRYNLAESQKSLKYACFAFSANFSYISITWKMFIFGAMIAFGLQLTANDMMNSKVKVKHVILSVRPLVFDGEVSYFAK